MLAFLTGATGFVGSHVARALAEHGADVRLLVRPNSNTKNIADLKADLVIGDLRDPVSLDHMIGHYKRSKFMAEQLAMEAGRSGMDVVVVNPTTPVGEQDIKPTPTGRIIVDFLKKKFPAYVDTGLNLVDVKECARGHIAALEKGNRGDRYILGGENLTLKQILDKLAAITG